jgi:lysyl-tRNA synthetase class II
MDRTHNPEFTAMEIYVAQRYNWMMDFTERLLEHCATLLMELQKQLSENIKLILKRLTNV